MIEKEHIKQALGSVKIEPPASSEKIEKIKNRDFPAESSGQSLREIEKEAFLAQLRAHSGTRSQLAEKLGISDRSLYRKLRTFGFI